MFYTSYIIKGEKKTGNIHEFQKVLLFSMSHKFAYLISGLQRGLHYI